MVALSRRTFVAAAAIGLLVARSGWAATRSEQTVEDWSERLLGASGIPAGWQKYETPFGRAAYDFTLVDDEGRRALALRSAGDHSTIAKPIRVSLAATPVLAWQWKVLRFPVGADLRERATSDATGHLFVVWPRVPSLPRSRLIGYVWDPVLPPGTVVRSRKTGTVTFIVVRSGGEGLGQWRDEHRDIVEDYRMCFGETPESPRAIALSIDTNDTRTTAETLFGRITFTASRAPGCSAEPDDVNMAGHRGHAAEDDDS
jgi:hypothetical protein